MLGTACKLGKALTKADYVMVTGWPKKIPCKALGTLMPMGQVKSHSVKWVFTSVSGWNMENSWTCLLRRALVLEQKQPPFYFVPFVVQMYIKTNRIYKCIPDLLPHERFKLCHSQTGLCIQGVSCQPGYWKKNEFQKGFIRRKVQAALVCNSSIRWSARKLDFTDTNILHGHCHNQNFTSHRF